MSVDKCGQRQGSSATLTGKISKLFPVGQQSHGLRLAIGFCLALFLQISTFGESTVQAQGLPLSAHPRLFFKASDLGRLQDQAATTHSEIWLPIQAFVDSQVNAQPDLVAPVNGKEDTYRNAGNQLIAFAFACVMADKPAYCALAKRFLLAYANWTQWDEQGKRDLGHSHMLMGNALAYDWLYSRLSLAERQTVRASLVNWTRKLAEAGSASDYDPTWRNWWRKSYFQNHYWTNNSALGMASLALLGEDARAAAWLDQAEQGMRHVTDILNGIQDGSWHEGIPYQSYGLTMMLPFLVNLKSNIGLDLIPERYLRNYVTWGLYNYLPERTDFLLAYGDFDWSWGNAYQPQNLYRYLAAAYDDPHAEWLAEQLIAADGRHANIWSAPWYVFEFFYYDAHVTAQAPTTLAMAHIFPDLGAVVWRTGWQKNDLAFGLKSGAYGGRFAFTTFMQEAYPWDAPCVDTGCQLNIGHDHKDNNGFYLYHNGQWLAPETAQYGGYATSLHNTLLIDGQGQSSPPEGPTNWADPKPFSESDGYLAATASSVNFAYLAANATHAYQQIPGIQDFTRYVLLVRPSYLLMVDNLAAKTPHTYTWVTHLGERVQIQDRWVRGDAGGEEILGVDILAPLLFTTTIGNDGQPFVHIQPALAKDDVHFVNLLYPTTADKWATRPTANVIADTQQDIGVQLQWNDDSQRQDDLLMAYTPPITATHQLTRSVGAYLYDGRAAVVTRGANDQVTRLFMVGGTVLVDQTTKQILVSGLDRATPFEAIYTGSSLAVSGHSNSDVTLYAPGVQRLTVNLASRAFTRIGDSIVFRP